MFRIQGDSIIFMGSNIGEETISDKEWLESGLEAERLRSWLEFVAEEETGSPKQFLSRVWFLIRNAAIQLTQLVQLVQFDASFFLSLLSWKINLMARFKT